MNPSPHNSSIILSPDLPKLPSAHRSNRSPKAAFHTHNLTCQYSFEQLKQMDSEDRFIAYTIDQTSQETTTQSIVYLINQLYWPFVQSTRPLLSESDITITPVSGGITNSLYRVNIGKQSINDSIPILGQEAECEYGPLLIRAYGVNTESVIDRTTECHLVNTLSKSGRSVKMHGTCLNGRVEQWLDATPLTPLDMKRPLVSKLIAKTLAQMHTHDHSTLPFLDHPDRESSSFTPYHRILPQWANVACSQEFHFNDQPIKQSAFSSLDPHFWRRELTESLQLLMRSRFKDEKLVFSHGDLLAGNILQPNRPTQSNHLYFIDFEYASFHYAAYDIANHFCENCGFEMIWSQFPDSHFQRTFIQAYLTEFTNIQRKQQSWKKTQSINEKSVDFDQSVSEEQIDMFQLEIEVHLIFSHLFWGIWAMLQARYSAIDFDYMGYSALRKEGYLKVKERSWKIMRENVLSDAEDVDEKI